MANKNLVISEAQIERFRPETTARWLSEYLLSGEGVPNNVDNYLAHVLLVDLIYENFAPEKELNFYDYHEEVRAIFGLRTWSPYMMKVFLLFKDLLEPEEWAPLWWGFYRRSRQILMAQLPLNRNRQANILRRTSQQLATLQDLATTPQSSATLAIEPG